MCWKGGETSSQNVAAEVGKSFNDAITHTFQLSWHSCGNFIQLEGLPGHFKWWLNNDSIVGLELHTILAEDNGFPLWTSYVFMRTQQLHNYLYWEQLFIWFLVFNLPCSGFQFNITSTKLWMYHLHTQSCMLSNQPNPRHWMFISFTLGCMRQNGRMHNQEEVVLGLQ